MGEFKSYLSKQIRLMTLNTYDLFTDEECQKYYEIVQLMNEINRLRATGDKVNEEESKVLIEQKKIKQTELATLIEKHNGTPRNVRLSAVLDCKKFVNEETGEVELPAGITWKTLRANKRIAEFLSDQSRAMGLNHLDVTFDKIIVKWKSIDLMRQIVMDGINMNILNKDGTVTIKHYSFRTASAGQLRVDKIQMMSDDMWDKIKDRMTCGLTTEQINEHGGVNIAKLLAYTALASGASEETNWDIDKVIVVKDWQSNVTGVMDYISNDYKITRGEHTVEINHIDGAGMCIKLGMLDFGSGTTMLRGPWIKGLVAEFDVIRWCKEHNIEPILEDYWGIKHDLIKEDIEFVLSESQFKMIKYYDSWEEYKDKFKKHGCKLCVTNYEKEIPEDTELNYQFEQSLVYMTDEELQDLVGEAHQKIENICSDKDSMLRTLGADKESNNPYQKALFLYPELLREAYSRETLKAIKKRWMYDSRSGCIKSKNKRLFAIPDLYAWCEVLFLGKEQPEGIVPAGYVYSRVYKHDDEADILRSPHLYMEHAIRKFLHTDICKKWFNTNGIYVSCHDLITRVLQMDCDGDHLNVVTKKKFIECAKRNIELMNIVPLFYDANKSPKNIVNPDGMFMAVKLAHDYSGIGAVSNMLTKLWNRDEKDTEAAALIAAYNNRVIDAAKIGSLDSYENYPDVKKKINKATGGKNMPFFFKYSKNGRKNEDKKASDKKEFSKINNSTMNRICAAFDDIGNINMNYAGVPQFNYQMLLDSETTELNEEAITLFCTMDDSNLTNILEAIEEEDNSSIAISNGYDILAEMIRDELVDKFGSLESVYSSIVKHLFSMDGMQKISHKQMFWRIFGDIAVNNIQNNLHNYTECQTCGMKVPKWVTKHICNKRSIGFLECIDCGKLCERTSPRQCRCDDCQDMKNIFNKSLRNQRYYQSKKDK